jgi:hypothetical protein
MKTAPHPAPAEIRPLRDGWHAWERFWFAPGSPTNLGLMRLLTGLLVLYIHVGYAVGLTGYVGPTAWVGNDVMTWLRQDNPQWVPSWGWDNQPVQRGKGQFLFSAYFHVTDPTWICVVHGGVIFVTLLFTLGLASRVTSVMTWICHAMYLHRAQTTLFGMDTMTNLGLFYLMIAPSGAALSLDRWLEVRRGRRRFGPAWVPPPVMLPSATFATRLIQVNFCYIYLISGFAKLLGASWWNGTAPTYVLLNYSFAPFNVGLYAQFVTFLTKHRWLWEILMASGVIFTFWTEIGLPFLIWNRKLRWLMICSSALLHTAIGLFMGLVTFSLMMLILLLAFVPPEVVEQVLAQAQQRIKNLLGPRAAPASPKSGPLVLAR